MARHLREQSGGNPADHGPAPELANEPASPRSTDDFPDTPVGNRPGRGGGDLSDEQLDDFAARLGLTDDDVTGERPGPGDESSWRRRIRRPVARALSTAGRMTSSAGDRLAALGERLEPR